MWMCASCGEAENEEHYKFCYTCGDQRPEAEEGATAERAGLPPPAAPPPEPAEEFAAGGQEHGFRLPDALASLGQRFRRAAAPAGDQVISVRVSTEAQEAVELLLQAGRFESQADAAGFLLEEGAQAQAELLRVIRHKLAEIERLRAELRGIGRAGVE